MVSYLEVISVILKIPYGIETFFFFWRILLSETFASKEKQNDKGID